MNITYLLEHKVVENGSTQYRITVIEHDEPLSPTVGILNHMIGRENDGFQVLELYESIDLLMEAVERYMKMEQST